jgi:demethylmenaquinone methyltransferase/2-methoxy-6-polyprenyl-1,4-benzoquinol methylase
MSIHPRELPFIRQMFDNIAPHYDLLNRLLSLRRDVAWRREMAAAVAASCRGRILDVACGTGDVIIALERRRITGSAVVGVDFSFPMLKLAQAKLRRAARPAGCRLSAADAFRLPFKENCFGAVTIAFGIRNIQDKGRALEVFHRHLAPGGGLFILELTPPGQGILLKTYLLYFEKILPFIGGIFSKNTGAYRYLPSSVLKFPSPPAFARLMRRSGFSHVRYKPLTLGIATLFAGFKAPQGTDLGRGRVTYAYRP